MSCRPPHSIIYFTGFITSQTVKPLQAKFLMQISFQHLGLIWCHTRSVSPQLLPTSTTHLDHDIRMLNNFLPISAEVSVVGKVSTGTGNTLNPPLSDLGKTIFQELYAQLKETCFVGIRIIV